jgi:hypothetical protein
MPITTNNLQATLSNIAEFQRGQHKHAGPDLKLENSNIKNLYMGKDGQVHVSNSGFMRWVANLGGRKTGMDALRQGMEGKGIKPAVVDKAMQKITDFQARHAQWTNDNPLKDVIQRGIHEHLVAQGKREAEPSLSLGQAVLAAHTEYKMNEAKLAVASAEEKVMRVAAKLKGGATLAFGRIFNETQARKEGKTYKQIAGDAQYAKATAALNNMMGGRNIFRFERGEDAITARPALNAGTRRYDTNPSANLQSPERLADVRIEQRVTQPIIEEHNEDDPQ